MLVSQTSSVVTKSHSQLFATRVKTLYTCLFLASVFHFVCMHRSLFVYLFICSSFYFKVTIITLLDFRIIVPPLLPPLVGVSKTAYVLPLALMTASIEEKQQELLYWHRGQQSFFFSRAAVCFRVQSFVCLFVLCQFGVNLLRFQFPRLQIYTVQSNEVIIRTVTY